MTRARSRVLRKTSTLSSSFPHRNGLLASRGVTIWRRNTRTRSGLTARTAKDARITRLPRPRTPFAATKEGTPGRRSRRRRKGCLEEGFSGGLQERSPRPRRAQRASIVPRRTTRMPLPSHRATQLVVAPRVRQVKLTFHLAAARQ